MHFNVPHHIHTNFSIDHMQFNKSIQIKIICRLTNCNKLLSNQSTHNNKWIENNNTAFRCGQEITAKKYVYRVLCINQWHINLLSSEKLFNYLFLQFPPFAITKSYVFSRVTLLECNDDYATRCNKWAMCAKQENKNAHKNKKCRKWTRKKQPATNINKERTAHKYEEKHEQIKRDGAKEKHVVLQHQLQLQ